MGELSLDDREPWGRVARAALDPGEEVFATGEVMTAADPRAGCRGAAGLVLRPAPGEPMRLSTVGLALRPPGVGPTWSASTTRR